MQALSLAGFDRRLPTVYFTGGAQGAQQINGVVRNVLPWLLSHANVIHQCGPANVDEFRAAAAGLDPVLAGRYHLTGFVGAEPPDVQALADVVVSRSGTVPLTEIQAGLPTGSPEITDRCCSSAEGVPSANG